MKKHYSIFADFFQFYLWDKGMRPEPPCDYTEADIERRIKVAPYVVVIQPERNMTVPVEFELRSEAPDDNFEAWDHVAEATLELPSGEMEIVEYTVIDTIKVEPGTYRVRAYYGALDDLSEDGLDGNDHYRLAMWRAPAAPLTVLKQFRGGRGGDGDVESDDNHS